MLFIRFIIGGLLVAGIPELAKRYSPRVAGLLVLVPIISILVIYFTGIGSSTLAAQRVSQNALLGLIPLAIFFTAASLLLRRIPLAAAVGLATLSWVIGSLLLFGLLERYSS